MLDLTEDKNSIRLIRDTSRSPTLKFNGNVGNINPALFVKNFEEDAELQGLTNREKLITFMNAMKGEALVWVNTTDTEAYSQIKQDFLSKYWNERIQQQVIDHILDGRYNEARDESMKSYFRKFADFMPDISLFQEVKFG